MSVAIAPRRPRRRLVITGFVASVLVQLVMIAIGVWAVILTEDDESVTDLLALWCLIGTLYEVVVLIVLGRLAKRPAEADPGPSRFEVGRLARLVSLTTTIFASLVGFTAALQVLGPHNDAALWSWTDFVGVWAMLLAWGFLHWGFSQIYFQRYYSWPTPLLRFPETERPRFVDFVYFSFTLGTSFAASDVEVLGTRMRWTIVWHSVLSYFFNGLIIVLALNTIMGSGGH